MSNKQFNFLNNQFIECSGEKHIDTDSLWSIATGYSKTAETIQRRCKETQECSPPKSLEERFLQTQARIWRQNQTKSDETPSLCWEQNSCKVTSAFVSKYEIFFQHLRSSEPKLWGELEKNGFLPSLNHDDNDGVNSDLGKDGSANLKNAPKHSNSKFPRASSGEKSGGKRGKGNKRKTSKRNKRNRHRNRSITPKNHCTDGFFNEEGGKESNPIPNPSQGSDTNFTPIPSSISSNADKSSLPESVIGDNMLSDSNQSSADHEGLKSLIRDAVEKKSLTAFLLVCKMLLDDGVTISATEPNSCKTPGNTVSSSVESTVSSKPIIANSNQVSRTWHCSITCDDMSPIETLKTMDPRLLQNEFLTAASKSFFNCSSGLKMISANLSGRVLIKKDKTGLMATGKSSFGTFGIMGMNTNKLSHRRKIYYEVRIKSFGRNHFCQIGWATEAATYNDDESLGVGDQKDSWSFCGKRHLKYNAGGQTDARGSFYGDYNDGKPYKQGDIVGCLLDLDEATIEFSINGKRLGKAFDNIPSSICEGKRLIFPCVSVSDEEQVHVRVGTGPLSYLPPGYEPVHKNADLRLLHMNSAYIEIDDCPNKIFQTSNQTVEAFFRVNLDSNVGEQILFAREMDHEEKKHRALCKQTLR